jgi:hypothetical protein
MRRCIYQLFRDLRYLHAWTIHVESAFPRPAPAHRYGVGNESTFPCIPLDLSATGLALMVYPMLGYSRLMRTLRYSINVTLDGCCIVQYPRTKTCIVTPSKTSARPMLSSLAG